MAGRRIAVRPGPPFSSFRSQHRAQSTRVPVLSRAAHAARPLPLSRPGHANRHHAVLRRLGEATVQNASSPSGTLDRADEPLLVSRTRISRGRRPLRGDADTLARLSAFHPSIRAHRRTRAPLRRGTRRESVLPPPRRDCDSPRGGHLASASARIDLAQAARPALAVIRGTTSSSFCGSVGL